MGATATRTWGPDQRMAALGNANAVRAERVRIRRGIGAGTLLISDVLESPPREIARMGVLELLSMQRQWGSTRAEKVLNRRQIGLTRSVGELTERQRLELAAALREGRR